MRRRQHGCRRASRTSSMEWTGGRPPLEGPSLVVCDPVRGGRVQILYVSSYVPHPGSVAGGGGRGRGGRGAAAGHRGRLLAAAGGDGAIGRAGADRGRAAAVFVAPGIVGAQADRHLVRRQDQQLAARGPEVLVLIVFFFAR